MSVQGQPNAAAAAVAATAAAAAAQAQAQGQQAQNQGAGGQGAGGQGAGGQGSGAPPAIPFILTPSMGNHAYIDFSTAKNQKIYYKGIEKLDDTLFNGTAEELILLKQLLSDCAREMDWTNTIIDISIDPADPAADTKDIIMEHSQLTLSQITDWANFAFLNMQNRAAQDNMMMFNCLTRSVDRNCRENDSRSKGIHHPQDVNCCAILQIVGEQVPDTIQSHYVEHQI